MYNIGAVAIRSNGLIKVSVFGSLSNSFTQAEVVDTYPGTIVYVVDPGQAELHIEESTRKGRGVCLPCTVPWGRTKEIADTQHRTVAVFVNREKTLEVEVIEENAQFIVIAHFNSEAPNFEGCSIVSEGNSYPKLYKKVFGPSDFEECCDFVAKNCASENP